MESESMRRSSTNAASARTWSAGVACDHAHDLRELSVHLGEIHPGLTCAR